MKRNLVLGIVAGLAIAGLSLGGCSDSPTTTDTITGADTDPGIDTPPGTDTTPEPDTVVTGDTVVPPDGPGPDGPVGKPQLNYRVTRLAIETPGEDQNTGFAELMNTVLPIAFAGGTFSKDPLYILATFSDVSKGASGVVVTFCQGAENADGSLSCVADPAPVSTTGTIDNSGNITTDVADFTFAVATPAGDIALTLANFTMSGLLDATADNGPQNAPASSTGALLDGTFEAQLPADDLCGITLTNDLLGAFCGGVTTVNLLDLLDGPAAMCGQDGSADFTPGTCTASTDKGAHNPPIDVGGDLRFETTGAIDLEGIVFTP